jgi:hypothetical protein
MMVIEIKLDKNSYMPGDSISGTARWQLEEPVQSIELRLFYYTEGKGTSDVEIVETTPIANPGLSGSQQFQWRVPDSPYSFSGKLISLIWAVEAVLLPSGDADHKPFTISPTGQEIDLRAVQQ